MLIAYISNSSTYCTMCTATLLSIVMKMSETIYVCVSTQNNLLYELYHIINHTCSHDSDMINSFGSNNVTLFHASSNCRHSRLILVLLTGPNTI